MSNRGIIVIGASAGGVEALEVLVRGIPADLSAAVFVVLHIPADAPSILPAILTTRGKMPASHPADGQAIKNGHVYVAPPDHHLVVEPGRVRVVKGPRENRHRPSVDVLFRSAALAYGPRVIGVILSGALDDVEILRFRCRVGHTYTANSVVADPAESLESAALSKWMAERAWQDGHDLVA